MPFIHSINLGCIGDNGDAANSDSGGWVFVSVVTTDHSDFFNRRLQFQMLSTTWTSTEHLNMVNTSTRHLAEIVRSLTNVLIGQRCNRSVTPNRTIGAAYLTTSNTRGSGSRTTPRNPPSAWTGSRTHRARTGSAWDCCRTSTGRTKWRWQEGT